MSALPALLSRLAGPAWKAICLSAVVTALLFANAVAASAKEHVTIFAASSMTNALEAVAGVYEDRTGVAVRTVFAASSTLARQVYSGAPADIFISASPEWMDYLADRQLVEPGTQTDLLSNALVLVAPKASDLEIVLTDNAPLAERIGPEGYLAVADPAHVPAGRYAKAALESLGLWPSLSGHLALAGNVRAALALVERGEASAGVVYLTDAWRREQVRIVAAFPADSHPPIVYPVAIVNDRETSAVRDFYDFLRTDEAGTIFRDHKFGLVRSAP